MIMYLTTNLCQNFASLELVVEDLITECLKDSFSENFSFGEIVHLVCLLDLTACFEVRTNASNISCKRGKTRLTGICIQ